MTPVAEAIVRAVLETLEAHEVLTRGVEEVTELRQALLVQVARVLARARLGVPDE